MRATALQWLVTIAAADVLFKDAMPDCRYHLEIALLQDGSGSFIDLVQTMKESISKLLARIEENFGDFKFAVTTFIDKPLPFIGYGPFGAFEASPYQLDYCYNALLPLTRDMTKVQQAMNQLDDGMGSGMDLPEDPYHGLISLAYDKSIGWTPTSVTHTEDGRPIARLALLVTDDVPKRPGDATPMINKWNSPRPDGFGGVGFFKSSAIWHDDDAPGDSYMEMALLLDKLDSGDRPLNEVEEQRLDELIRYWGPLKFDTLLPHPGDDSLDCMKTEYPSVQQAANALKQAGIIPLFLVANPPAQGSEIKKRCTAIGMLEQGEKKKDLSECLAELYTRDAQQMGLNSVAINFAGNDDAFYEQAISAIEQAVALECLSPATPPPIVLPTGAPQSTTEAAQLTTITPTATTTAVATTTSTTTDVATTITTTNAAATTSTTTAVASTKTSNSSSVQATYPAEVSRTGETSKPTNSPVIPTLPDYTDKDHTLPPLPTLPAETDTQASDATSLSETNITTGPVEGETKTVEGETKTVDGETKTVEGETKTVEGETKTEIGENSSGVEDGSSAEEEFVPPPVPPSGGEEGGSKVGVIAGASAGGVAGLAGVAALAYKKLGMSILGNGASTGLEAVQQVETPENPLEREAQQDISLDMFQ